MTKLNFVVMALACTFSSIFCAAENDQNTEQMSVRSKRTEDNQECQKLLNLKDFAGAWTFGIDSLGGVAGPAALGSSFTIDGQVTFDTHGVGTVNFASGAQYSGDPGSFITFSATGGIFTLTITDPIHGIGTMVFTTPGETVTVDVIVTRDKRTGKAIGMEGHETTFDPTTDTLVRYSFSRQYQ